MKKAFYIALLSLYSILCTQYSHAQNSDSLWKVYNNKQLQDTGRLNAVTHIIWTYTDSKPDSAILLAQMALRMAGENKKTKSEGILLGSLGLAYFNKGNYPKALEYYLKSLKVCQQIGSKMGEGRCYNNIGIIYKSQLEFQKALTYFFKSLKIAEEINDKNAIGNSYNDIGNVYLDLSNYPRALEYYLKDLKICEETGNLEGQGSSYANIGGVYNRENNFPKALECYLKGLEISKKVGDNAGIAYCYGSIGELYSTTSDYKQAVRYIDSSIKINREMGDIDQERYSYQVLAEINAKTHNYKAAYETHVKFKQLTDSIFNAENSKQLGDMKTQFEVEKKESELKIKSEAEQEKLKAVAREEKKRQNVIIGSVAGVLLIVIMFSLFLFNRFRITQRQKSIIEKQKVLVDEAYEHLHEKNKEVMDSINYASRIQRALLPSQKYIANNFNRLKKN